MSESHQAMRFCSSRDKSLIAKYPMLLEYWDFSKNTVDPYTIYPTSNYMAHWTCKFGHNCVIRVRCRILHPHCKECEAYHTVVENSLLTFHPEIAKEWDYEMNYPLRPENIKPRHRKKVWWICPLKGHSYRATPDNRVGNGSGCPVCNLGGREKGRKKNRRFYRKPATEGQIG